MEGYFGTVQLRAKALLNINDWQEVASKWSLQNALIALTKSLEEGLEQARVGLVNWEAIESDYPGAYRCHMLSLVMDLDGKSKSLSRSNDSLNKIQNNYSSKDWDLVKTWAMDLLWKTCWLYKVSKEKTLLRMTQDPSLFFSAIRGELVCHEGQYYRVYLDDLIQRIDKKKPKKKLTETNVDDSTDLAHLLASRLVLDNRQSLTVPATTIDQIDFSIFGQPLQLIPPSLINRDCGLPKVIVNLFEWVLQCPPIHAFRREGEGATQLTTMIKTGYLLPLDPCSAGLEYGIERDQEGQVLALDPESVLLNRLFTPDDACSVIKRYLNSIPGKLIPRHSIRSMYTLAHMLKENNVETMTMGVLIRACLLASLPISNLRALSFISLVLVHLAEEHERTKMGVDGLGLALTPCLVDLPEVDLDRNLFYWTLDWIKEELLAGAIKRRLLIINSNDGSGFDTPVTEQFLSIALLFGPFGMPPVWQKEVLVWYHHVKGYGQNSNTTTNKGENQGVWHSLLHGLGKTKNREDKEGTGSMPLLQLQSQNQSRPGSLYRS